MTGPEGGEKGGKNLNTEADQEVGPGESCVKIWDFVRIMGKFLEHENSYPVRIAKKFRWKMLGCGFLPGGAFEIRCIREPRWKKR